MPLLSHDADAANLNKCHYMRSLYAMLVFVAPGKHSYMYTRAPPYPLAVFCLKALLLNRVIPASRYTAPPPPEDVRLAAFDRNVLLVKLVCDTVVVPSPAM